MTAATSAVTDFALLLPPGWARIPLDSRTPLRIKSLVTERVAAVPPQHRGGLRAVLTRELMAAVEAAARQGGVDVLLSVDPVAGSAVPASGLVTHVRGGAGGDVESLQRLLMTGAPGVAVHELGVVEIAGGRAVRRLTSRRERVPGEGDGAGDPLTVTQLDFFVPVPGTDDVLVLTFSTAVERLAPPLVRLFDVIGGSLRWVLA